MSDVHVPPNLPPFDVQGNGKSRDPIAIVGIGCRYPGGVTGPESFWKLLCDGVDAITEIPPDRIDVASYYDPRPATPGKMMTRWGGFLEQIDRFDANFFGISPREAERMDPQQRLLLEVAWEAVEDAGLPAGSLAGSSTAVFIGMWLNDYEARLFANPADVDFYMTTGTGRYSASGRLSYFLGLQGPSLTVDSACSSSLVAVHLACQSLRSKECSMALAGGANVILQPHISIAYSQSKMMAPDGRCKFGDKAANGYVRSEGAGVILLKPLADALQEGDPIYAVIHGSAVNNDGNTSGYMTTPARAGQEELLRRAYRDAGICAGRVQYVEAHGTGTLAGDPVEIGALTSVMSSGREPGRPCYVGSVKTNIGHTEGAAGIAGLIKTALIVRNRHIPASLHLKELNPSIAWKDSPLVIPRESTTWPFQFEPAFAGVSAFGIAGTNAHIVLGEAPRRCADDELPRHKATSCLLPLSAHSPEALKALARAYLAMAEAEHAPAVRDVCFTAALRRTHHEHRLGIVVASRADLRERLKAFLDGEGGPGVCWGKAEPGQARKVVFVCPGQGSQWVGMGRQLMVEEPIFRNGLERCAEAMQPFVDWSLLDQLSLDPGSLGHRLDEIDVIQPTLLSIEIALADLWRSWGVVPDAVTGHSMGEVAAVAVAEALCLSDVMRIICERSRLLRRVSGKGAMAVVALPMDEAQQTLAGFENRISVAVSNSPRSTVLSGDPAAIEQILEKLRARDVFCRVVKVDVASHSPQMDLLTEDLLRALGSIQPRHSKIPIYSTVTAERRDGEMFDAPYWVSNLRSPVLFSRTVKRMAEDEHTVFIELSPHPILIPSIEETLHHLGRQGCATASLERDKDECTSLLGSLGRLYTFGHPVDWARIYPSGGKVVSLPTYPWQRQRFWIDRQNSQPTGGPVRSSEAAEQSSLHALLGYRLPVVASMPGTFVWQNKVDRNFCDALREHRVDGSNTLPETAYVEMASAAANAAFGDKLHRIFDVIVYQPLELVAGFEPHLQFILNTSTSGDNGFEVFRRESNTDEWKLCAAGKISPGRAEADWLYELEWKEKPLERETATLGGGRWLIFADQGGFGAALAGLLGSRGESCVVVSRGSAFSAQSPTQFALDPRRKEHMKALLREAFGTERPCCRGIVYFWGLDATTTPAMRAAELRDSQGLTCDGVLHLLQSVTQVSWQTPPRIWLVTQAAQAVEPRDGAVLSLEQAPMWGLGRVIALEQPEFWGGLADLPQDRKSTREQTVAALAEEFFGSDGEDQVALRGGRRYVVRLVRTHSGSSQSTALMIRPDATYLITGGLGSIGLRLAHWLETQGARHLVLTSRTGLPDRCTWADIALDSGTGRVIAAVRELEAAGAEVTVAKADAGDEVQMSALWRRIAHDQPPLRGIIHAAGTLSFGELAHLTAEEFENVLRSKVNGARLLHQQVQANERELDFLVLFSSGASVWGSQRLGHYAAANHFLDALAQYRNALGLRALSVNWGWWEGAGVVSSQMADLFGRIGLKPLPTDKAIAALTYLLETGAIQNTVADVDWSVFGPLAEAKRRRPFLSEVLASRPQVATEVAEAKEKGLPQLLQQIQRVSALDRKPLLRGYIRSQVAEILGFVSSDAIDSKQGFFKMGMDSMMTVQLRNRLERSLNRALPPTLAFEYPTVDTLTAFLADSVIECHEPVPEMGTSHATETVPQLQDEQQEHLSEEALVELLGKKLEQIR